VISSQTYRAISGTAPGVGEVVRCRDRRRFHLSTYCETKKGPEAEAALEDLLLAESGESVAIATDGGLELHLG
jgi:hypothetical protein